MSRKLRKNTRNDKRYAVFLSDARAFVKSNRFLSSKLSLGKRFMGYFDKDI
jgi:hypothetical protein